MSKRQILEYLLESNTSVSLTQVCLSLAMAVVLGMLFSSEWETSGPV